MTTHNEFAVAGWSSIAAAALTFPLIATGIATDVVARRAPELTPALFIAYVAAAVLHTMCGLYALHRFRVLLNRRHGFHRVDTLVTVIIVGVILLTAVAVAARFAFLIAGLDPKVALLAIPALAMVSVPLAVVSIVFAVRLLTLESDLNGLLRPLAYLTIAAGVCFATFVLAPVGLLIDAVANVILGMIFLRPEAEPTEPEFV